MYTIAQFILTSWRSTSRVVLDAVDVLLSLIWHALGRKPFRMGYMSHRRRMVKRCLERGDFGAVLPTGFGLRLDERIIEYPWVLQKLGTGSATVLDAGSTLNFDFILQRPEMITKQLFIATLAPELRAYTHLGVSYVFEDFRRSCFRADFFDVVACISTLEHVGMDNTRLYTADVDKRERATNSYFDAIDEFRRILKPGGRLLITVPYGVHTEHGWYQVFDEQMVQDIAARLGASSATYEYFRYGPEGWHRATAAQCADAETFDVHTATTYTADFLASARAICCLELVKSPDLGI
jgi:hypothetical protein